MDLPRSTSRDLEQREHINETSPKLRDYKNRELPLEQSVIHSHCTLSLLLQLCDPVEKQTKVKVIISYLCN